MRMLGVGEIDGAIRERVHSEEARAVLRPLDALPQLVEDRGIPFCVRLIRPGGTTALKERHACRRPGSRNPFLPPEPELLVGSLEPNHHIVLNKFNVLEHHALLVTRDYKAQDRGLDGDDFQALATLLADADGLAFFNSGPEAGASQPHRHAQWVPRHEVNCFGDLLLDEVIERVRARRCSPGDILPFLFQLRRYASPRDTKATPSGSRLHDDYLAMSAALRLLPPEPDAPMRPHNLLLTRRWMLLVPRPHPLERRSAVNALGFAGALLAKTPAELETIRSIGPLEVLKGAGIPKADGAPERANAEAM